MTNVFIALWRNTEQQLLRTLDKIDTENVKKRIKPEMRSLGVIMLHIGEAQMFFAKTMFGAELPPFKPRTSGPNASLEDVTDVDALKVFVKQSCELISTKIAATEDSAWNAKLMAPWKEEAPRSVLLGFAMNHTMQHVGQVIQALKYGE